MVAYVCASDWGGCDSEGAEIVESHLTRPGGLRLSNAWSNSALLLLLISFGQPRKKLGVDNR